MNDEVVLYWLAGIAAAVFVSAVAVAGVAPYYACPARWERSGLRAEFSMLAGCMVLWRDGTWVPERAVRATGV